MTKYEMLKEIGLTNYYNDAIQQKKAIKNALEETKGTIAIALATYWKTPNAQTREFIARVLCKIAKFNCPVNEIEG